MDGRLFEIFISARQAVHRLTGFVILTLAADSIRQSSTWNSTAG
jgi:hypothetical protein